MASDFGFMRTEMELAAAEADAKRMSRKQRALMEFQLENQLADTEARIDAFKKMMDTRRKAQEAQAAGAGGSTKAKESQGPFPPFGQINVKDPTGPMMRPKNTADAMSAVTGGAAAQQLLAQQMSAQAPGQPPGMGGVTGMAAMGGQGAPTGTAPQGAVGGGGQITGGLEAPATRRTMQANYGVTGLSPVQITEEPNVLTPGEILMAQLREKEVDLANKVDLQQIALQERKTNADIYLTLRNSVRDPVVADVAARAFEAGGSVADLAQAMAGATTIEAERLKLDERNVASLEAVRQAEVDKLNWMMNQNEDMTTNIMRQPIPVIGGLKNAPTYYFDAQGNARIDRNSYKITSPAELGEGIDNITDEDGNIRNANALMGFATDFLDHGVMITYKGEDWFGQGPNHGQERVKDLEPLWKAAEGWDPAAPPEYRTAARDYLIGTGMWQSDGSPYGVQAAGEGPMRLIAATVDDYFNLTIAQGRTHTPEPMPNEPTITETPTATTYIQRQRESRVPVGSTLRGAIRRGVERVGEKAPELAERAGAGVMGAGERWISDVRGRLKKIRPTPEAAPWFAAGEAEKQRRREWFKKVTGQEF